MKQNESVFSCGVVDDWIKTEYDESILHCHYLGMYMELFELWEEELNMQNYDDENCGHCVHHRKEDDCWMCTNPDSECYGCFTEYNETCNDFEERRPKTRFSVEIVKKYKKV